MEMALKEKMDIQNNVSENTDREESRIPFPWIGGGDDEDDAMDEITD